MGKVQRPHSSVCFKWNLTSLFITSCMQTPWHVLGINAFYADDIKIASFAVYV